MASLTEVDEFTRSALFTWVESCLPHSEHLSGYDALLGGTILHKIWLHIDPEPQHHPVSLDAVDELSLPNARARNFDAIVKNIKALFEEELDQTLLVLPDCAVLGHAAATRAGLDEMKLLLTLLLGAAVQCPNKQHFISGIKELDLNTQHGIVELIKQVTDTQTLVLTNDSIEHLTPERMYQHIIRIARERDKFQSNWIQSLAANDTSDPKMTSTTAGGSTASNSAAATASDNNHLAVELADLKSKLRRFRQELEEKSEAYIEVKEDLEHTQMQYEKLRTESQEWYTESRRAAAYRDEVDILQERAERANRLELEVQRFREKLSDSEFFKARVEELREDNRMLLETKEMLEEQLQRSRKRSEHAMQLETEIIKYKQKLNDMALERDADKSKLQELLEENTHLLIAVKQTGASGAAGDDSQSDDECASGDNSLSEQLTNNAQTRVLKLELENRRLQQSLDTMNESSFHENASKLLDSEKEKKRLSLKVEQMQENCARMTLQNKELEDVFRNALDENKKLQDAMDQRQLAAERQMAEREADRQKFHDTEKHVETLVKEKQRIQTLSDSIQRRADDLERNLAAKTTLVEQLQKGADRADALDQELTEFKNRVHLMEKESATLTRDVAKLRENLELKDVLIDQNTTEIAVKTKEVVHLNKVLEETSAFTAKITELEAVNHELISQHKIHEQTIATLQKDLVDGTLATQRVQKDLERLGIDTTNGELDAAELNVEFVVNKLVKNPETFKTVKEIMLNVGRDQMLASDMCVLCHKQEVFTVEKNIEISDSSPGTVAKGKIHLNVSLEPATNPYKEENEHLAAELAGVRANLDALQSENARQKVDLSTLSSQITSLSTQHVALQLANSQLAAEKDVLVKNADQERTAHSTLLQHQMTLQCLHEQLNAEYEGQSKDKELLKAALRDQRTENRDLKEHEAHLTALVDDLKAQLAALRTENDGLCNLRPEHSKLKEDFRNLFTTSERLKNEYKNIQEQYKLIRHECGQLRLQLAKLTDELNTRAEQAMSVDLEYTKCTQRCEMLLQMNANLDTDRRTLMDHVSQLLSQYHELLAHSLDDKQHYHDEEKLFTDKVNNLHRQKEKLEEKIMEHYKKLESCSPKKKPFGASFVKRVKKASSDLINKVPSRSRRSWMIDETRLTQSEITLGGAGSESGGNESDNSLEDPHAISDSTLPPMLQRNAHHRQSLQRRPTADSPLLRAGMRSSFQSLRRDDSVRSHRNSIHSMEPPDVTGSSLTLGTAGSRRTVYLLEDNARKLAAADNNNAAGAGGGASPSSGSGSAAANHPNQHSTATGSAAAAEATVTAPKSADPAPPSTLLMFNRISNVLGNVDSNGMLVADNNPSRSGAYMSAGSADPNAASADNKSKEAVAENGKETAVWYEYGCV